MRLISFNAPLDTAEVDLARLNLAKFVRHEALLATVELGFGWRASTSAPSTLADLTREFRACTISGLPLRVSSLYCDDTIYFNPEDNQAFRFLHDSRHVFLQCGFDLDGELLTASCHLARLRHEGFGPESIEFRLLYADTVGQALFAAEYQSFPTNQLRFALRCVATPLSDAISDEYAVQARESS